MKRHIAGLDLGGTKCAVVLAEAGADFFILDRMAFPTGVEKGFEYTKGRLFESIREILASNRIERLESIGISCGGPLDSARGVILSPPNLPGWDDIPLTALLEREFGVPAYLQNDANACALVEWKLGAGRGTSDMVFLTMGTGMGAGIIAGGRLLTGPTDTAGEVGHVRLGETGPEGYGKAGSFEGFCSGGGIARAAVSRARELLSAGRPLPFGLREADIGNIDARLVVEAAVNGDPEAVRLLGETGKMLGRGIAMLLDVLNPEAVVIGSIFVRAEKFLRPSMEAEIGREALPAAIRACRIVPASTGEAIGDLAAVMTAAYAGGAPAVGDETGFRTGGRDPGPSDRSGVAHGGTGKAGARSDAPSPARTDVPFHSGAAVSGISTGTGFELLPDAAERAEVHIRAMLEHHPDLSGVADAVRRAYGAVTQCFVLGGKILVCGNGGSAADSDHIVGELLKAFMRRRPVSGPLARRLENAGAAAGEDFAARLQIGLPAVSLTGHPAFSTAFANDVAPETVFAQQVLGLGKPGDVLLCLSTSGNSRNVLFAAATAHAIGMTVVAMTGPGGGKLKPLADILIDVPGNATAYVQEHHLPAYHALCAMVEDALFDE